MEVHTGVVDMVLVLVVPVVSDCSPRIKKFDAANPVPCMHLFNLIKFTWFDFLGKRKLWQGCLVDHQIALSTIL